MSNNGRAISEFIKNKATIHKFNNRAEVIGFSAAHQTYVQAKAQYEQAVLQLDGIISELEIEDFKKDSNYTVNEQYELIEA